LPGAGKPKSEPLGPDIDDRKRSYDALLKSEERFRTLFENSAIGLYRTAPDGRVLMANQAIVEMLGYSSFDELARRNLEESGFEPQYPRSDFKERIEREGRVIGLESAWTRSDGTTLFVRENATVVRDECGKSLYYEGTVEDITDRKRAEDELRKSEEHYRMLAETINDGLGLLDKAGMVLYVNRRCGEIFGYSSDEMIGRQWADIFEPEAQKIIESQWIARRKGAAEPYELATTRKDGSRIHVRVSPQPMFDEAGRFKGSLAIVADITERKRAEEKLIDDQAKLKSLTSELSLAEERERRRIAVELHDQIGQSLIISKMKLDALDRSEFSEGLVNELDEICESLGQTISDTSSLTFDLSSPILYELGFEAAVSEWLAQNVEQEHGIMCEFEDDGGGEPLDEDIAVLLFRDVRELLVNVVKHSQAKKVKVSILRADDEIRVSVEDDGVGFDPEAAAKRTEFGLFSVRERLEQLGGHLEIVSAAGRGCRATLVAPLKRRDNNGRDCVI